MLVVSVFLAIAVAADGEIYTVLGVVHRIRLSGHKRLTLRFSLQPLLFSLMLIAPLLSAGLELLVVEEQLRAYSSTTRSPQGMRSSICSGSRNMGLRSNMLKLKYLLMVRHFLV